MARNPRFYAGPYGDGTIGLKTSLPGFNVKVLADDNDVTKRSFNSQWPSLCKIKLIGSAMGDWSQYQSQGGIFSPPNGTRYYSQSGWMFSDPVQVPTGLTYVPVWEERQYKPATKEIFDDNLVISSSSSTISSYSGARSYFSGPSTTPANTIFFTPWTGDPASAPVANENSFFSSTFVGYPAYPAYPAKPSYRPYCLYVVYSNKMGDST